MTRPAPRRPVNPIAAELAAQFKAAIPRNEVVVKKGLDAVLAPFEGDVEQVKANVSRIITDAEVHAYKLYKDAQWPAMARAIRTVLSANLSGKTTAADAIDLVAENVQAFDQFFLSVSQGRRARAGSAVETFFDHLFRGLGYHFEREHVVNGTPDFVFPSVAHFKHLPTDCIVFTSKRTLRERWRQITSEGSRGFVLFLGTLDEAVKPADLADIQKQKIVLVVPEHIRAAAYPKIAHVISIERFLEDHLDPAMKRWRRDGVIP